MWASCLGLRLDVRLASGGASAADDAAALAATLPPEDAKAMAEFGRALAGSDGLAPLPSNGAGRSGARSRSSLQSACAPLPDDHSADQETTGWHVVHKRKRARAHGFLRRSGSTQGRRLLARRRRKGRARLST